MKNLRELMKKTEMQIAPLIDVVFLLLIYFMVTASLVKNEADMAFTLPLPTTQPHLGDTVEVLTEVSESGDIMIEGMVFRDQNKLIQQLTSLKTVTDASGSELVVSVLPADKTQHGHIIPVMDACAAAGIENLSFSMAM